MIRLPDGATLAAAERYALAVLVDLSRLLPFEGADDVVRVEVVEALADGEERMSWGKGSEGAVGYAAGVVRIPRTALRWVTEVAGAGAEQRATARDRFDRVPPSANPLVAAGMERTPLVSLAAAALRSAVVAAAGRRPVRLLAPWPLRRRWAAAFTHDLDVVAWWPLFTLLRVAELGRKGNARLAARSMAAALASVGRDPVAAAVRDILAVERGLGIRSTWFVLTGTPTLRSMRRGDLTYLPESRAARRILEAVRADGHEIALHGSFDTMESAPRFREQRERLRALAAAEVDGVRQHYLRMRPGITQRAMHAAGFRYDATYGFADRSGYRLGVADIVPGWDEGDARPSGLAEVPLVWMDRSLSKYRGIEDPDAWASDALELAERSRRAEGLWVGLWHPNLSPPLGYPGAPAAYRHVAGEIASGEPYIAPVGDLARWRATRAAARATRLLPGGGVELRVPSAPPLDVAVEDERARAVDATSR